MMPAAASSPPRPAYRRKLHYVDKSVQRSLLLAMVALEAVLVAASTWFVYRHLSDLLDESLYRVHLVPAGPTLAALAQDGFGVLGLFALLNVFALLVAEAIWSRHENSVLHDFALLIGRTRNLDFCSDTATPRRHEVIALALAWRARERSRFATIRDEVRKLEAAVSAGASANDLRTSLQSLKKILP